MTKAILYFVFLFLLPVVSLAEEIKYNEISDQDWRNGVDIPKSDWHGNDINGQDGNGGFYLSNGRATISSKTDIDVPLSIAAGIFFDFNYSHLDKYQDYELSWRFPKKAWSLRQGVHFQLEKQAGENQKVFIPFSEIFSSKKIEALRLTLDGCSGCKLYFVKTRIVGMHEIDDYEQYIPKIISYVNRNPPPSEVVLRQIKTKLMKDIPFFIFYSSLLVSIIIGSIWRVFRSKPEKTT